MKIPFAGGSNQERSLPVDAQRTINLYAVADQEGKEQEALYGTPGKELFATCGSGPTRGGFYTAGARGFVVSGAGLYEIDSAGTATLRGSLDSQTGIVSIDENGLQLGVCDGTSVYIFTYATNVFAKVVDVDLPSAGTLTFIDGYFVINKNSSGSFYISALYDGTSWASLDFATAESSPDNLLRVINAVGQLWLLGTFTGEIWTNTGASAFPFERISGAKMGVGILAPHTAVEVDNSLFWVGRDKIGSGIVYRAKGFSPERISNSYIERLIQAAPTPSTLRAYTYQEDGHTFYVITGGGMDTSPTYDVSTQLWHERAFLNSFGQYEQDLGAWGINAFSMQLVGSRVNGKIYTTSLDIYQDDGNPIKSQRTFTHLSKEGKRFKASSLQVDFEYGTPETEQLGPQHAIPASLMTNFRNMSSTNPLAYTNNDATLFVPADSGNTFYYAIGDVITLSGASTFGGFSSAQINTTHILTAAAGFGGTTLYTWEMPQVASGTGFGGGTVTIATGLITVTATSHGLSNGDRVKITGASDTGGILAAQINAEFEIRNVTTNTFDIMTAGTATSSVTAGGGTSVLYQKIISVSDPVATLEISRDGGKTFSGEYPASLGAIGEYRKRAIWRRLGVGSMWTFRVTVTDPVKRAICGAYLQ